ncbi:hypothetical protein L210DRAFT_2353983 [Boletus edulis BED1]|uniref:Uncharacterized protein n=1 Tax=Boletus edulis BED1 TaxID=1328754 RepID=A0AAD4BQB0_BOLED|nr:hypothetical protein L210DRAFT_2353983 [Boletus edulis BED1]
MDSETGEVPNPIAIEEFISSSSISTSTHVLMAISFYGSTAGWRTFFQAFALPPPHPHNNSIPTPTPTAIGPSHRGTITFQPLGPFIHPRIALDHPSFTGTSRVFYMRLKRGWRYVISTLEYDVRARAHGNRNGDDDGAHEAEVVEYPDILRLPTKQILFDYDPYSGRICLLSDMEQHSVIEVLSFGV